MKKLIIAATTLCALAVFVLVSCNKNAPLKNQVNNTGIRNFASKSEAEKIQIISKDKDYILINQKTKALMARAMTSGIDFSKIELNNEESIYKLLNLTKEEYDRENNLIDEAIGRVTNRYQIQNEVNNSCSSCKQSLEETFQNAKSAYLKVKQDPNAMAKWERIARESNNLGVKHTRSASEGEDELFEDDGSAAGACFWCKLACRLMPNPIAKLACILLCEITVC